MWRPYHLTQRRGDRETGRRDVEELNASPFDCDLAGPSLCLGQGSFGLSSGQAPSHFDCHFDNPSQAQGKLLRSV